MTIGKWIGIALAALALSSCRTATPKPGAGTKLAQEEKAGASAVPSKRLVYPWSVVSGGVDSSLAMRTAMQDDPVVETHYAGLNPAAFRTETLPAKRQGYVSYRIRDKIYWTRRMVTLQTGETVLSDGRFLVRGRCGNLVSPAPREPVAPDGDEPEESAMDLAVREAQLIGFPLPPVAATVETETFLNPKRILKDRDTTAVLLPPDPREMMPPVGTLVGIPSPGGGIAAIGAAGNVPSTPPAAPPAPGTSTPEIPGTGTAVGPISIPARSIEVVPPLVLVSLLPPPETPVTFPPPFTPVYTREFPPGSPPAPPPDPPLVYYPPSERPPASPPPPNTPPPNPPPPSGPPSPPPPPLDPPLPPPPPETHVPEPGTWILLALGLSGIAFGAIRRKF